MSKVHSFEDGARVLDGNAAAGPLADVFALDISSVVSTCASCRAVAALGAHRAYRDAPGLVLRCPACSSVVLRLVVAPGRGRLDLRGSQMLEFAVDAG